MAEEEREIGARPEKVVDKASEEVVSYFAGFVEARVIVAFAKDRYDHSLWVKVRMEVRGNLRLSLKTSGT